jgi:hypothetical protein
MDRRTLLKIMGGIAALPALGKAIKGTGIKAIKAAGKVLPKVSGMPEWFTPLVNKIMKEGVDISPKVSRVEDFEIVKKLEIPSETGKPEVITFTQNKATGSITIESNVGGVADSSFELHYSPPKTDINVQTGEPVKYPGDFYVVENRPKPDYNNPGKVEFDYDTFDIDSAYSDLERLEKIGTGKIKDTKKIEQRAAGRQKVENDPYDDIMDRYPDPDPSNYRADGGLISFANGGKVKNKSKAEEPLSKYKSYSENELLSSLDAKMPNLQIEDDVYYGMPSSEYLPKREYFDLANGGRAGYGFGGMITKIINDPKMKDVISQLPPETAQAISVASDGGGLSGLFKRIIGQVKSIVSPIATGAATPNVMPTTPTEIIPPASNSLTRPLGMAGFGGSEIVDILKRLGYSFADGGSVQTGLTKTVPPAKGPDSQGVETLFKRRYN